MPYAPYNQHQSFTRLRADVSALSALDEAARQAMLKEAFEGVPGFAPTAKELQHMADIDAEKNSEGHVHRNTLPQRHE